MAHDPRSRRQRLLIKLRREHLPRLPCFEIRAWVDLAAPDAPIVGCGWARDTEMKLRINAACVAAGARRTEKLPSRHPHSRHDAWRNRQQVRSIVAHAIIPHDCYR